jgi:hypothetical protein
MRLTKGKMFTKTSKSDLLLEEEIVSVIRHLKITAVDSEEYAKVLNHLDKLYALKGDKPDRVKKDTMAVIGGNLLGILMILKHERMDIITSKALSFVIRAQKP